MTKHSFCSMAICLAVILLSGCEAVLNSLVNEPLFSARDEWYDGQTYKMWDDIFGLGQESSMRISACNRLVGTLCKEIILTLTIHLS